MYQPPVGIWKTTPARRLLWATKQLLMRIERDIPERAAVDKWATKIEKTLAGPVLKFNWERWWRENVEKADKPDLPEDLAAAWESLPDDVKEKLYKQAGETRVTAEGLPFDQAAMDEALDGTMHLVKSIPANERDALRNVMRVALEEGEGQFGFAKRIRQEWAGMAKAKAEQIAVTEWNRAASAATFVSYKAAGVEKKAWFTAGDDRVCPICDQNSSDGEIGINESFASGDLYPPPHPGCRCNMSSG